MSWLIKTEEGKFEVWSDAQHAAMKRKCEYYGSEPSWIEIRHIVEKPLNSSELQWSVFNEAKKVKGV